VQILKEIEIGEYKIKIINEIENMRYFAPQITYPKMTIDFFLLHPHHLISIPNTNYLLIPSISGDFSNIHKINGLFENMKYRVDYTWIDLYGFVLQNIYPTIYKKFIEFSKTEEDEEKRKSKLEEWIKSKVKEDDTLKNFLKDIDFEFFSLIPDSITGYLSHYILKKYFQLLEGFGKKPDLDNSHNIKDMVFTLYQSNILIPIFSTSICTNNYNTHMDFLLSNIPLRENKCRICNHTNIIFNLYLLKEPYNSFKKYQKDISYTISSYLSIKSMRQLNCYPEVYVKKEEEEEHIDVFLYNLFNGMSGIIECKIHEKPKLTYETKLNVIKDDISQLIKYKNNLKVHLAYLLTNIHFNSNEEQDRIIVESLKKLNIVSNPNIKIISPINSKNILNELNLILTDFNI